MGRTVRRGGNDRETEFSQPQCLYGKFAVEMRKLEVKFDKPIYVGMCILDISNICLYEFHHEYMSPLYRDKCKIIDADSLIYHIECEDETMKRDSRFESLDSTRAIIR